MSLCKELQEYLHDHPTLGKVLQHPLVYSVPYLPHPKMDEMLNKQLHFKKQALQDALQKRRWASVLALYERPFRWEALLNISVEMEPQEIAEQFAWVWTDSENIYQNQECIEQLLAEIGDTLQIMTDEDRKVFEALPEKLTVYRGCSDCNRNAMSWTLDKKKAVWFARRFARYQENPTVLTGEVCKDDVLFYTNQRDEQEIVARDARVIEEESLYGL